MARAGFLELIRDLLAIRPDRQPGPPAGSTVGDKTFV